MDHKITKKLLKLVGNPNATTDQLMAGIELMDRMAAEDARARAAQPPAPPKPVLTEAERVAQMRRAANANLVALRKRRG